MATFAATNSDNELIEYTDSKRYLWLLSLLWPLSPVIAVVLAMQTENIWLAVSPLLIGYGLVPLLDYAIGVDKDNPPEEVVSQLDADSYYRWIANAIIPLHFISLIVGAWFVATHNLPIGFYIAISIVFGISSGLSINTAHEIGHKNTKLERVLARIAMAVTGYGHFCVEHNLGHHRDVSTPEDPASSRMGESIYRFALREIPGAAKRGWKVEADRLTKRGLPLFSHHNHILQSYAVTAVVQGALIVWLGMGVLPFLILHNLFGWLQLTSANYIEHYGLLRAKLDNGKYERCQPHHSWNANHLFSNLLLYQLERHSDHHANPARPYQSLRAFDDLPELPSGYSGMYLVAYIPPLWYKVMDERLLACPHIDGDLSKVNLDPKHRERLIAHYAA